MPAGSGLDIPRLDGLPIEQQLWQGEQAAARLAHSFLEAGIAAPDDWVAAEHNPFHYLKAALERWLGNHGSAKIGEQFSVDVLMSTSLDRYFAGDSGSDDISRVFIALEPDAAGYVILGPTLRLLESVHPRLPATFLDLFLGALNRWVRVYDFCCRQQKSYFVAMPVMWRKHSALPQPLVAFNLVRSRTFAPMIPFIWPHSRTSPGSRLFRTYEAAFTLTGRSEGTRYTSKYIE